MKNPNILNAKFHQIKFKANKRKKEFLLTFEEFKTINKNSCYYCNSLLNNKECLGLDRIDNNKGYTIDNCISCCYSCNVLRGKYLTVEETKEVIMLILKMRNLLK